ncbi:hypothetical protein B0H15DRAFT_1025320 [Mycena belliarum]|uniref:Uncharacterized protein n=1 Tax=Mycena belliarum TaxID=1033014 RepID=A0AAD6TUD4_9AGAR|nr:hypothetical protein B0H15DRAFT_1025320 [Mycena belliae]
MLPLSTFQFGCLPAPSHIPSLNLVSCIPCTMYNKLTVRTVLLTRLLCSFPSFDLLPPSAGLFAPPPFSLMDTPNNGTSATGSSASCANHGDQEGSVAARSEVPPAPTASAVAPPSMPQASSSPPRRWPTWRVPHALPPSSSATETTSSSRSCGGSAGTSTRSTTARIRASAFSRSTSSRGSATRRTRRRRCAACRPRRGKRGTRRTGSTPARTTKSGR